MGLIFQIPFLIGLLAILGEAKKHWWQVTTVYEIYVISFKDSDGDGSGDLNGVTSKLEHFVDMGVETIWLAPFYKSPLVDGGYDISDFRDVNEIYGTLADFDRMVKRAHELGLKVVVDFVPNHSSTEHEWFKKSVQGIEPYTEYYVWHEGKIDENGTRRPPTNWLSVFNSGSAWEWVPERNAYYLHQFSVEQADLNFNSPLLRQEILDILTFWLDRDIDGFRVDSVPYMIEDPLLRDEPASGSKDHPPPDFYSLRHTSVMNQEQSYELVQTWKEHVDNYTRNAKDNRTRVFMTEAYGTIEHVSKWYDYGSDIPFNFFLLKDYIGIDPFTPRTAVEAKAVIDQWMDHMPPNGTANWVIGNHDNLRAASRFHPHFYDAVNFILFTLPGVMVIYTGDEIGMTDTPVSWEDTIDPQACNSDPEHYQAYSRDPARTPFQWDNSTSAGFSVSNKTFLPVNENYLHLNLAAQKAAKKSIYKNIQSLMKLRNTSPVLQNGNLTTRALDTYTLVTVREYENYPPIVTVANGWPEDKTIDLSTVKDFGNELEILIADIYSGFEVGGKVPAKNLKLPSKASLVLTTVNK